MSNLAMQFRLAGALVNEEDLEVSVSSAVGVVSFLYRGMSILRF
jgi:hypothetical protein